MVHMYEEKEILVQDYEQEQQPKQTKRYINTAVITPSESHFKIQNINMFEAKNLRSEKMPQ